MLAKGTGCDVIFTDVPQQRHAGGDDEKLDSRNKQNDPKRQDGSQEGKELKEVKQKDAKMEDGSHKGKKLKKAQQKDGKRTGGKPEEEKKADYEKPETEKKRPDKKEPKDNLLIGLCIANAVLTVVALVLVVYYVVLTASGCPSGLPESKLGPNPQDLLANGVLDLQNIGFGQVETQMYLYKEIPKNNITYIRLFGIDGQKKAILFGGGSDSRVGLGRYGTVVHALCTTPSKMQNMRRLYGAFCTAKDTSTIGAYDNESSTLTMTWSSKKNEIIADPPMEPKKIRSMPVGKKNASCFLGLKVYAFTVEGSGERGSGKSVGGKVLSVKITP